MECLYDYIQSIQKEGNMNLLRNIFYTALFLMALMVLFQAWYIMLAVVAIFVVYKLVSFYTNLTTKRSKDEKT